MEPWHPSPWMVGGGPVKAVAGNVYNEGAFDFIESRLGMVFHYDVGLPECIAWKFKTMSRIQ